MAKKSNNEKFNISELQNKKVDFKKINLDNEKDFKNIKCSETKDKKNLNNVLKAYQRLLRIVPDQDSDLIMDLLKVNIHSATQITGFTKRDFIKKHKKIFKGKEEIGNQLYDNALKKRSQLVVQYMDILQNNEPHVKASKV